MRFDPKTKVAWGPALSAAKAACRRLIAGGAVLSVVACGAAPTGEDDVSGTGSSGDPGDGEGSDTDEGETSAEDPSSDVDWDEAFDHVFPQDRVVDITLDFPDAGLSDLLEDWNESREKNYYPGAFAFDDETLPNVGGRLKGYSSLLYLKPPDGPNGQVTLEATDKIPLKVNFNEFGGERFHHVDRIGLGNNVFDPSYMRERLGARLYNAMGVPAARTAFASVRVDGNPNGIYTMVQALDERFLKERLGTDNDADDGNLYKCVSEERNQGVQGPFMCSLAWRGDRREDYLTTQGCSPGYEQCGFVLKTNDEDGEADYADLIELIDVLSHTPDAEFEVAISEVLDVDAFLRLMAVTAVLSSYDSYFGRVNNYYLYHRPDTDKFIMLPWDLNMTYGLYHCGREEDVDLTQADFDDPTCKKEGGDDAYPLADRILAVDVFRELYLDYVGQFLDAYFRRDLHEQWIDEFDQLIGEVLANDVNYPFSMDEYRRALSDLPSDTQGWLVVYNLLDFVERRRAFVTAGLGRGQG